MKQYIELISYKWSSEPAEVSENKRGIISPTGLETECLDPLGPLFLTAVFLQDN